MRSYTVSTKLDVLRRLRIEFGGNLSKASRDLSIDRKRIREWLKHEDQLVNATDQRKRRVLGGGKKPYAPDLEASLFAWFEAEHQARRLVSYNRIRSKATELRDDLHIDHDKLKLSDKWIFNFCKRHRISSR